MASLFFAVVTVHVIAAVVWLGGLFFFALVGAPALRRLTDPALRAALFRDLGERFRTVGWTAIAVLLVTGVWILHLRGLLTWEVLGSGAFWGTPWGTSLAVKLGAIALMLVVSGLHDFVWGPASSRAEPGSPEAVALRRRAAWLARGSALLGLVILIYAVRLARGG